MTDLDRRYLLTLLLRSYEDALPGLQSGDTVGRIPFGSRAVVHLGEAQKLWRSGSYQELHDLLNDLSKDSMRLHHAVWIYYVYRPAAPRRLSYVRQYAHRLQDALLGIEWLLERMPRRIRVPLVIIENAGQLARPRARSTGA